VRWAVCSATLARLSPGELHCVYPAGNGAWHLSLWIHLQHLACAGW
jgi:hypothetical protein